MKIFTWLTTIFFIYSCNQKPQVFDISTETVQKNLIQEINQIKKFPPYGLLFHDENYEVWSSCSGEWGGSVYFKNKKTGKIFATKSVCAVSINKINLKYYISNSLVYGFGSSGVIEISNPENLQEIPKLPIFHPEISVRDSETSSSAGTKKLIDSSGILIRSSFIYNNKLYSILTDNQRKKNTISEIKNNKFQTVQELPDDIFYNEPIIVKDKDNHQKIYFQHPTSGTLEITDNQIKITYYEK
ncbi:hypothetical protein [Chryseobacterium sp.]|uniref:hypothetical protein n=1 Tax=Chryseobacterium sp. TaxID=1871047 RepID=UPI00289BE72A|nr:hypothetical protein [Chryseobacterium sp.]